LSADVEGPGHQAELVPGEVQRPVGEGKQVLAFQATEPLPAARTVHRSSRLLGVRASVKRAANWLCRFSRQSMATGTTKVFVATEA
jgi:hypothetical protein